jgi:hypothetical protein
MTCVAKAIQPAIPADDFQLRDFSPTSALSLDVKNNLGGD